MRKLMSAALVAMAGLALSATDAAAGGTWFGSTSSFGNFVCQAGEVFKFDGSSWKCVAESKAGGVKFVFVTSTTYLGNIASDCTAPECDTGPGRADFECNRLAATVGLPGKYAAWLSDDRSDAIDRLPDPGGPWFNLRGELVAASKANLIAVLEHKSNSDDDTYLYNAIGYTEMGASPSTVFVWTGTDADGFVVVPSVQSQYDQETCKDWTATDSPYGGVYGIASEVNYHWTGAPSSTFPAVRGCGGPSGLYCFQR